ncbi:MAG: calcineurin-like phosphoesterase family protein [Hyphomicrobiales bacterium]|nr:calcineurin-like phosphoesterase family protein [Hyphomicrobiales bacterium]
MTDRDEIGLSRREVVKGTGAVAVTLAAATWPASASLAADGQTVTGIVFEDRSHAGRRQAGDKGIAGVLVSNGREIAKTDGEGRYTLPIEDGRVIFVIKPTGYAVPLDENNLPRFFYIHQPEGSPADLNLHFRGIAPTGPLPASVDFPLRKTDEASSFDVIMFTDPQPESDVEVSFIRDAVVNRVIGMKAAFGITTGDLMFDDLSLYNRYNRIIGQIGLPWYSIGGNHDLNFEARDRGFSRETFKRVFGPAYYAFEYGGAVFIMLDNVDYLGGNAAKPRESGKYEGRFDEKQLGFVANLLKEVPTDKLVVACMHIPLRTYLGPDDPVVSTANARALLELLSGRPNTVSFSGHTHTTEHHYFGAEDGFTGAGPHHHHVMTAVCGSWWSGPFDHCGIPVADSRDGTPNGFHVLSVAGNRYTTRFQPANEPNARQMRIMLDSEFHRAGKEIYRDFRMGQLLGSPIAQENVYATDVVVNLFDGGPRSMVEYLIGNRPAVQMARTVRPDPFVEEVYARNVATKKPWVNAEPCSHLFVARLPGDLEAGTHCLKVRAVDEYGRTHDDNLIVEVTGADMRDKS